MTDPWFNVHGSRGLAHLIERVWEGLPGSGLPRRLRQSCRYSAYVPDHLAVVNLALPGDIMADVSDAARAIQRLNSETPTLTQP